MRMIKPKTSVLPVPGFDRVVEVVRKRDIDAICPRCEKGEKVKRYSSSLGTVWSHTKSWLDVCPSGPIWELVPR